MKIQKNTPEVEFKPFDIVITIESEPEAQAIYQMATYDLSIPNMVTKPNQKLVQQFLMALRKEIIK